MNDKNAYNLLHDLMEEIDKCYDTKGRPPYAVEVNNEIWNAASSIDGFPPSLYTSRVVCGQTVWPVSDVDYISVQ